MSKQKIGLIGVGLMGHGIATNIQKAGWDIGVLDHVGNQPINNLIKSGAQVHLTIAQLTAASEVIILCVTGSPQVEDVLLKEQGVLENLRPGTVIIDCSTAVPASTLMLASKVEEAGGLFLDAPMTRTPKEAAQGRLNVIVGGDNALFERQLPLLQSFAENIKYAGGVGSGHTMKLLHNFVSLGFSAVLAEATTCANKAGIDPKVLHGVLAAGGGAGIILDRLAPYILEGDDTSFQFSLDKCAKDMGYYTDMASDLAAPREISQAVHSRFQTQIEAGHGARYVPHLIELLGEE
ncbi:MAG: NAD(P)-dependent oxidoreductase [bacterium]|nr:NAD(P)-dependent oxidoreductase [bacterium]